MSRVKKNFIANLAGSGWTALLGPACTPLYFDDYLPDFRVCS
ncbi:MAG TPA: hypothetical protein VGK27_09310 [Candidatus Deferrimicrobiaceae bacterium]|jgi:hypothetical protein